MRAVGALACVCATGCSFIGFGQDPAKPPVDAGRDPDALVELQLRQTRTLAISGKAWSCSEVGTGYTYPNTWYRVFDLAAAGVTRTFHTVDVAYAIQTAISGPDAGGRQPLTVSLGTYDGAPDPAFLDDTKVHVLATTDVMIADGNNQRIDTPLGADIPAGAQLVAMLTLADGRTDHQTLLVASNPDGETGHSYWKAPDCTAATPTWMDQFADAHALIHSDLLLEVSGAY